MSDPITEAVDSVVQEATAIDSAETTEVEAQPEQESAETQEVEEAQADAEQEQPSDEFVPFPKKARNAISYRDKKIAKLEARLREFEAQALQPQQPQQTDGPSEDDFDNYGDYLEAKILHKLQSEKQAAEQPQAPEDTQRQQYVAEKEQAIAVKAQEYMKAIPDYEQVLNEYVEMVDYLPAEIQNVFYEANDAALAFYNLAKSGDLASLAEMTPTQAAMVIAQAQTHMPQPQAPQVPSHQPMKASAKGTGKATGLNAIQNDPDKLMKWLNS